MPLTHVGATLEAPAVDGVPPVASIPPLVLVAPAAPALGNGLFVFVVARVELPPRPNGALAVEFDIPPVVLTPVAGTVLALLLAPPVPPVSAP